MRRRPEPLDRIAVQYAGYVSRGILLQVRNGEIEIQTPEGTVTEMLRSEVDKNKAALIEHLKGLAKNMTPQQYAVIDRLIPSLRMITWIRRVMAQQVERTKVQPPPEFMEWLDVAERLRTEQIDILDEADWQALFELAF